MGTMTGKSLRERSRNKPSRLDHLFGCGTWLENRSDELVEKTHEGDSAAVWQLVRILKTCKKQPRIALARVHNAQGTVVKDKETLTLLWVQQFSEDFSGNVIGLSPNQAHVLLADRRAQSCQLNVFQTILRM